MMSATHTLTRYRTTAMAVRVVSVLRGLLSVFGLLVLFALLAPGSREVILQYALASTPDADAAVVSPALSTVAAGPIHATPRGPKLAAEQHAVAEFISHRYRVADQAAAAFVATAYRVGHRLRVDPLLILAVVAVESRYNPVAESILGAKGLMQVIPKYHPEKLMEHGGADALLDPTVNIQVGATILRDYLKRFGQTERALQGYGGALDEPHSRYADKVLAERARLRQTVSRVGS